MILRQIFDKFKRIEPLARSKQPSAISEQLEARVLFDSVAFANPVNTQISSGEFPAVATATADLNGDGIPDLVADRDNLQAQVYFGTATGQFTLSSIYASGSDYMALGDFNNDNKTDLATGNGIYPGTGIATGVFGTLIPGFKSPVGTIHMYAQDVNGDGNLDLICATYSVGTGTPPNNLSTISMSVLLGNGDGTFKPAVVTTIGSIANLTQADATLAFSDFNGDGKVDCLTPLGIMLGNGDGTFGKIAAIPYKNPPSGAAVIPAAPIFAIGDFNGDANFDFATLPIGSNTGQVEIFLGDGKGGFTDSGPVTVSTTQMITSLDADFLTSSGNTDLMAGLATSAGSQTAVSDLAILVNNGSAAFATPTLYPTSGPPVDISVTDFNGDNNPDILSINGVAGSTTSTGLTLAATAGVLLNKQAALVAPILSLRSSANPAVDGNPVTYTATVQAPTTSPASSMTPTGTVTFFNGTTTLGTATLTKGRATFTATAAGVGAQSITFNYGGDVNYSSGTSSALVQTVLATGAKVPLFLPTLGAAITLPAEFLKGDSGSATVTLVNGGAVAGRGKIDVNFYLSQSGMIDSSAIALAAPALHNRSVSLASGKSLTLTTTLKVGSYAPGDYFLVAQVVPVTGLTADEVSSTPQVSTTTFAAAGLVFGTVGTHKGLTLKVADENGQVGTFSLTGGGSGTITQTNGVTDLSVTGTSSTSKLTISSKGTFDLDSADARSALSTFIANKTTLTGSMNLRGGVNQLTLASVSSPSGEATIRVGGSSFKSTLSLGSVGDLSLTTSGVVAMLSAKSWAAGSINAQSITNLSIAGSMGADVNLHGGGKIKSARVGTLVGGNWAIAGGIGSLLIVGAASNANIYAGSDSGADNTLNTNDDTFAAASIGSLTIGGAVTTAMFVAGGSPSVSGQPISAGIALLPKGAIPTIKLRGAVSDDSRFLAAKLPKIVTLNGAKVLTATDPHFQV